MTLIRKDRTRLGEKVHEPKIPHPLDVPNNFRSPDLVLSSDWTGFVANPT